MSESLRQRRTKDLRKGRVSIPGATYFLTCCTHEREPAFREDATADGMMQTLWSMHETGDWALHMATIMPDHVHLLFTLTEQLALAQLIGKFKALSRRATATTWRWQENVFEHRMRPHEHITDYGFYIFMNPYVAGLVPTTQSWTKMLCPRPAKFGFLAQTGPGRTPQPEWMGTAKRLVDTLVTGESTA